MTTFSDRHNLTPPDEDIRIRNEAPEELRGVLVDVAYQAGLRPTQLRNVVCRVLFRTPDMSNWSDFPNIDGEVRALLSECAWFEIYDVIEAIAADLATQKITFGPHSNFVQNPAAAFSNDVNRYFRRRGIGWQLENGRIEFRGSEAFELALSDSRNLLVESGQRATAANELHEALRDLARRPEPEITGAIQHAMAALECVARDVGTTKETLGELVRRNRALFPAPLDVVVEKAWGYSSNFGRHLTEGAPPTFEEAELVVGLCAVLCRHLARKLPTS